MDFPIEVDGRRGAADQRQLVTFVVFAYNQEKLIREAIEGAFSQTYEPLEIILSDDCSTDRTFDVMCEMAAAYEGPHTVRAVQNPRNLGVLEHGIARGKDASGEIVVVAAGDDISEPERTARLVDAFGVDPNVGAAFSWVSVVDESGRVVGSLKDDVVTAAWARGAIYLRDGCRNRMVRGCSAAYAKWVFDVPINRQVHGVAEDSIFSFYLNIVGAQIVVVEIDLVRYRSHAGSAMNFSHSNATDNEIKRHRDARSQIGYLDQIESIALNLGKSELLDQIELDRAKSYLQDVMDWPKLSFSQRLKRTLKCDYRGERVPTLKMVTWRFARLWGRYPEYQPKLLASRLQRRYRT